SICPGADRLTWSGSLSRSTKCAAAGRSQDAVNEMTRGKACPHAVRSGRWLMAFVAFDNDEAYRAWRSLEVSMNGPVPWLAGRGKRPVLALPDPMVCELAARGIAFTAIDEEELRQHLTPRGLAYYRHLRQHHPDHLYFNAPLPPALHVAMSCNTRDVHV